MRLSIVSVLLAAMPTMTLGQPSPGVQQCEGTRGTVPAPSTKTCSTTVVRWPKKTYQLKDELQVKWMDRGYDWYYELLTFVEEQQTIYVLVNPGEGKSKYWLDAQTRQRSCFLILEGPIEQIRRCP